MNTYLIIVLVFIGLRYVLDTVSSTLNVAHLEEKIPPSFEGIYNDEKYRLSQSYLRTNTRFTILKDSFGTLLTLVFLLMGGFNWADLVARSVLPHPIAGGLVFAGILLLLSKLLSLPFDIYDTFVIEERFGFNRTTIKTFILDILKGSLLALILGAPLLALLLWFFMSTGSYGWLFCWIGVSIFTLILQFLAPVLIMPLFNKFSPIEDGVLKRDILQYADKENFKIQGIYTMDGSKRSSKLNAFFTGFGSFRKIVFFDTLLEKLDPSEIIAVLAHEMGHFKLKHIIKMILGQTVQTGVMFYILSLFLGNKALSDAFGMQHMSIYSSLIFFGFIYSPVSMLISIIFNAISRKHEYDADRYAAETTANPEMLIEGLKKLSLANLSNLTPHPLHVFLHYSHPPVLMRIKKLQSLRISTIQ